MKVTPEHLATLRAAIVPLDTEAVRDAYRSGQFPRADSVKDLDKRYRFDLYAAAGSWRLFDHSGYNDTHIDTALRSIVAPLTKGEQA